MTSLVGPVRPSTWPEPNYANPETRCSLIVGLMVAEGTLATLFCGARLVAKHRSKYSLGRDDWAMAVSTVMMMCVNILACISAKYGSGYHTWDVKFEWAKTWGKVSFATFLLFIPSVSMTKISLCMSYLKLFPSRANKWFCLSTITFLILWSITVIFLLTFACRPIEAFWDPWISGSKCLNIKVVLILTGALNSLTDFTVFLWPVKTLWSIRLPLGQRLGLVLSFGIGCTSGDPYWECTWLWVILGIEGNFGIICGCLPTLKPLAKQMFPRFFKSNSDLANSSCEHKRQNAYTPSFPFQNITLQEDFGVRDEMRTTGAGGLSENERFAAWAARASKYHSRLPENGIKLVQTVSLHTDSPPVPRNNLMVPQPARSDCGSEEYILPPRNV
ncbi:uncharacterized protein K452DRAFT_224522 [Aplosporella prunicola CBS 121167]|uniref:Rhodopsin domain-containing protein n=1 Tax=Aplosporella prunicola CBS 121167 TaxID=1176127 RepID=A0A6A6BIC8_9PEZI|nr:uncharacterized protein K452DRAFT_224522 [Aplosporella prunicola CBS 121167]KAF2143756.1 hypothetical protein K452DRAFT_224522 [Aplosporella prunicola CBS 121167]